MTEMARLNDNMPAPYVGEPEGLQSLSKLQLEAKTSGGGFVGLRKTDRPDGRSVNAVGLVAPGTTHSQADTSVSIADGITGQPVLSLFNGGMARIGSSTTMPTHIADLCDDADVSVECTSPACLPTSTIADDNELDEAVLPEGCPVFDSEKLAAYPQQDDVVAIRHDYTRRRATGLWGEFEPQLLDHFDRFNVEIFDGMLPRLEVKMGQCASPRTVLGQYAGRGDHGMLGEITINQRLFHNGVKGIIVEDGTRPGFLRYVDDILLHEMVHAYCHLVKRQPESTYRGHGPIFTAECNRIGTKLGLDPVKHSKSKKAVVAHLQKCNQWPHCVRDPAYYLGAVVDVRDSSKEVEDDELASLLQGDEIGPGEMLRRLLHLARSTRNNRCGREVLAKALVAGLRQVTEKPDLLPQFPPELVPPGPVPDSEAA